MSTQEDHVRSGQDASRNIPPDYAALRYGDPGFVDRRKRSVFDGTINIPTIITLIAMLVTCVGFCFTVYTAFDKRLMALEQSDREQEAHFLRIEQSNSEFRTDIRSTLGGIQSTVGQIRDWMISDGRVSNRPEAKQWMKNQQ